MNFQNISKIEYIEDPVDYYDMIVDDTHNFCLANGMVVHNCGVGLSVQRHHVAKLPPVARRSTKKVKIFQVPDSIEGWADAFSVLLSSYFTDNATHPEFKGCQVHFDFTKIRPKGSMISGGFKAPGPDGLRTALVKCEDMIETLLKDAPVTNIPSIVAYDFVMHMSDAVLSGGIRRSATICVFDKDDESMLKAKTGNWFVDNPQRGRSNNSALLIRDELTRDEWANIMTSVKDFGEPGFIFADDKEFMFNPCVSGDALVTVSDHGVVGGLGVQYQIPMKMLVNLVETSDLIPCALSYNVVTGKKEWKQITAGMLTKKNTQVVEIAHLGNKLKCTPDHKILTKRGWVEAQLLLETDELVTV